ncbi:hypothetical protein FQN53_003413 [Emmonsiellopsis sp. PD_33]|nr:hypothetical protein FQN53_003413 [Emmonsiellopsis sp. PD_33]
MPSPARLLGPLEAAPSRLSSALYVCQTCRRQCLTSTSTRQPLRPLNHRRPYSSSNDKSNLPLTERLRRKVWGTDNPPGVKDVYGSESQLAPEAPKPVSEVDIELASMHEDVKKSIGLKDADYVPATTWDGLKRVGSVEWYEEPKRVEDSYASFLATPKASTREQFTFFLHQAMVELLVAKQIGTPLASVCEVIPDQAQLSLINQVEITPSADFSTATLQFPNEEAEKDIMELYSSLSAEESVEESVAAAEDVDEPEAQNETATEIQEEESQDFDTAPTMEISPPKSLNFLSISIKDPELKFAYLKRTAQLTGHRIPDNELASISKASHLLPILAEVSKTKKKKIADELIADGRLASLPNVRIMDRRYTPIDKEMEIGRWKIIEEELERRGLPVTGRVKNH